MRPMRPAIACAVLAAVALTGCGSRPGAAASSSRQAQLAVLAAVQKSQTLSLRYGLVAHLTIDASKLTGASAAGLGKLGGVQTFDMVAAVDQASPSRQRVTLTLTSAGKTHNATIVRYDGQLYYSLDGGGFERQGLPAHPAGGGVAALGQPIQYLDQLGFQDQGTTQRDGLSVERYEATIDQGLVGRLLAAALAAQGAQAGRSAPPQLAAALQGLLQQLVHIDSGTADVYVRSSDGRVDRAAVTTVLTVDLSHLGTVLGGLQLRGTRSAGGTAPLSANLPGGSVTIHLAVDAHLYDYGSPITVTPPAVSTAATGAPSGLGFFG